MDSENCKGDFEEVGRGGGRKTCFCLSLFPIMVHGLFCRDTGKHLWSPL